MRGWDGCPEFVWRSGGSVNWGDEGLGQPRQVMTAGMHGPSGQPIFDMGSIESCVHVKWWPLRISSKLALWLP